MHDEFLLFPPPGYSLYGGAVIDVAIAADNSVYWCFYGVKKGTNEGYTYVARSTESGKHSEIILSNVSEERGQFSLVAQDELYVVVSIPKSGGFAKMVKVPGFVAKHSTYKTNATYTVTIDNDAREDANTAIALAQEAKNKANSAVKGLENEATGLWRAVLGERKRVDDIYAQVEHTVNELDVWEYVKDKTWQLALDAQWFTLNTSEEVHNLIRNLSTTTQVDFTDNVKQAVQDAFLEFFEEKIAPLITEKIKMQLLEKMPEIITIHELVDAAEVSIAVEERLKEVFERIAKDL